MDGFAAYCAACWAYYQGLIRGMTARPEATICNFQEERRRRRRA